MSKIDGVGEHKRLWRQLAKVIRQVLASQVACPGASTRAALADLVARRPDELRMDIHRLDESGVNFAVQLLQAAPEHAVFMLFVGQKQPGPRNGARQDAGSPALAAFLAGETGRQDKSACVIPSEAMPVSRADRLSTRELELLELVAEGCTNQEISSRIHITSGTVRTHLMHIYKKLQVHCRTRAVAKFLSGQVSGLPAPPDSF